MHHMFADERRLWRCCLRRSVGAGGMTAPCTARRARRSCGDRQPVCAGTSGTELSMQMRSPPPPPRGCQQGGLGWRQSAVVAGRRRGCLWKAGRCCCRRRDGRRRVAGLRFEAAWVDGVMVDEAVLVLPTTSKRFGYLTGEFGLRV